MMSTYDIVRPLSWKQQQQPIAVALVFCCVVQKNLQLSWSTSQEGERKIFVGERRKQKVVGVRIDIVCFGWQHVFVLEAR